jgi:hypothetical protein
MHDNAWWSNEMKDDNNLENDKVDFFYISEIAEVDCVRSTKHKATMFKCTQVETRLRSCSLFFK